MRLLATMGWYDEAGDGAIIEIDLRAGQVRERLRWRPPDALRVPTKGLTGACWGPGTDGHPRLYVACHNAVLRVDPRRWAVDGLLHQPCFNDLHDVATDGRRLLVANTGAGTVDVFDLHGRFVGSHALVPAWLNARRLSGETPEDWEASLAPGWSGAPPEFRPRQVQDGYHRPGPWPTVKVVDHLHVNHVLPLGDRLLVTCLYDGTVRDLRTFEVFARVDGHPHDGVVHEERLWLTTIDGALHGLPLRPEDSLIRRDLAAAGPYGWCRGLLFGDEAVFVGWTEVRAERLPGHRWSERPPAGSETSVCAYDPADGRLLARVDLTDRARHAKVFALLPPAPPRLEA